MKRHGNLWEQVISFEALLRAADTARKGGRTDLPLLGFVNEEAAVGSRSVGLGRQFLVQLPQRPFLIEVKRGHGRPEALANSLGQVANLASGNFLLLPAVFDRHRLTLQRYAQTESKQNQGPGRVRDLEHRRNIGWVRNSGAKCHYAPASSRYALRWSAYYDQGHENRPSGQCQRPARFF